MNWVALRMLLGDTRKYLAIVFGVALASLLMGQQLAIFCGLMRNTTSQIRDTSGGDVWVMDESVQYFDDIKPMTEGTLQRVRGVEGVDWATRLYKGICRARLADGRYQQMILLGVDDASLVGAPPPARMLAGSAEDLRRPDGVIIDAFGWRYVFGDEPFAPGKALEINDKRAVIVGLCECSPTFMTFPVLYSTYSQAVRFVPQERKTLCFVLAKAKPGIPPATLARRIATETGTKAETNDEFFWSTIDYYLKRTGIPVNFGITVGLGFIVGCAIAGQTFYLFTLENLKQFGALKAMGVSNPRLLGMVVLQAATVGAIGYSLGIGGAAAFGALIERIVTSTPPAFYFGWQIPAATAVAVFVIITAAAAISLKKVLGLEAGVVFR